MTAGGDVTVSVRLGLDTLARDAAAAAARIRASLPDQTVGIKINNEGIGKLAADVLKAKAGLADTGSAVFLQKEAALLQEALRFKQQIADIENAYVDADDIKNAQRLAAELHDLNKQQIDRDFSPNVPNLPVPKGLAGHAQAFQDAVSQASQYTQTLNEVGAQLTQTGQQINAFTQQASGAAIAFDSARAKVATLADNSGELAQQSRDLSKELNFQVGSTELLGATYDIVSSGFEETADVLEILKAASQGAIGGLTDVGVVGDAVTSVLQSYNMNADQASKVTDILAQTVDSGKISFEQLAGGIGQITGIAFQAGVSFEELNAAIATATAKGTPASSSISGTRQAIINLLKPTADAKAVLEQFGIANAAATLKAEGLVGILQRLKDQGASTEQLSEIFSDTDGFAVVSQLAGNNLGAFIDNIDRMNNSAGKAQAATQQIASSFQGELTAALNQANEALIDLGNGVLKAATPLVQALGFILTNFNKLPEGVKESIGVVVALTGGLVTLAGAVLSVAAILPIVTAGLKQMGIMATAAGVGTTATAQGATAASVSLRGMATAAGGLLLKMGLLAAAMKTTEIALSRFKDGGESFNAAAEKIEQSLVDLQLESGRTRTAIESALPKDPPPTDFVDGIVSKFNDLNGTLNRAFGLPEDFLAIPENSQKMLEDARAGVLNLQTAVDALVEGSKSLSADFLADKERGRTPGTEQVEQAKQTQEAFTTALEGDAQTARSARCLKVRYRSLRATKTQLEGTIEQLEREKTAFERNTGLQAANTQTTQQGSGSSRRAGKRDREGDRCLCSAKR
jgi:TP901 family phage tail tape measure protein